LNGRENGESVQQRVGDDDDDDDEGGGGGTDYEC